MKKILRLVWDLQGKVKICLTKENMFNTEDAYFPELSDPNWRFTISREYFDPFYA